MQTHSGEQPSDFHREALAILREAASSGLDEPYTVEAVQFLFEHVDALAGALGELLGFADCAPPETRKHAATLLAMSDAGRLAAAGFRL